MNGMEYSSWRSSSHVAECIDDDLDFLADLSGSWFGIGFVYAVLLSTAVV